MNFFFSEAADDVLRRAGIAAVGGGERTARPEHILLALLDETRGPVVGILAGCGVDRAALRVGIAAQPTARRLKMWGRLRRGRPHGKVLEGALREARELGQTDIGPEHLLLGIFHDRNSGAAKALEAVGVTLPLARAEMRKQIESNA